MNIYVDQFNYTFLNARPYVCDVMDDAALFAANAWDAAWDDLFHCWCGCPL